MMKANQTSQSNSLPEKNTKIESQSRLRIEQLLISTFCPQMKQQIQQQITMFQQYFAKTIEEINLFKRYVNDQFEQLQMQLYSQSQMSPIGSIIDEQQSIKPSINQNKDSFLSEHSIDSLDDFQEQTSKSICLRIKSIKIKSRSKSLINMKIKE